MNTLTIAGEGTCPGHMTGELISLLKSGAAVLLQTERTYLSGWLTENRVDFSTVDDVYAQSFDFDELNSGIAQRIEALLSSGDVVYCVPGSPLGKAVCAVVYDRVKDFAHIRLLPGTSFADAALSASGLVFSCPAASVFAQDAQKTRFDVHVPLVVSEIDSPILAGSAKLALGEFYPDEQEVTVCVQKDGEYICRAVPLYELDRLNKREYAHTTCAIIPPVSFLELSRRGVAELDELIGILRAPGGCPWDREQTIKSLRSSVLEEAYEVVEAIDLEDDDKLCEELGDLLLQVVFLSRIAGDHGSFSLRDVSTDICAKLVYRHPHVFSNGDAKTSADVLVAWDKLKMKEKHQKTATDALLSVPKTLPALTRSAKVQKRQPL